MDLIQVLAPFMDSGIHNLPHVHKVMRCTDYTNYNCSHLTLSFNMSRHGSFGKISTHTVPLSLLKVQVPPILENVFKYVD